MSDLISRSALHETFSDKCIGECECCGYYDLHKEKNGKLVCRCKLIDAAPTIEAEPVVNGNWGKPFKIDAKHIGYKCSKCGCYGVPGWNYCPNCGANMKGEKQNETRGIQNSL